MENENPEKTQTTSIVPTTESTAELIPESTARLVEKSLEKVMQQIGILTLPNYGERNAINRQS